MSPDATLDDFYDDIIAKTSVRTGDFPQKTSIEKWDFVEAAIPIVRREHTKPSPTTHSADFELKVRLTSLQASTNEAMLLAAQLIGCDDIGAALVKIQKSIVAAAVQDSKVLEDVELNSMTNVLDIVSSAFLRASKETLTSDQFTEIFIPPPSTGRKTYSAMHVRTSHKELPLEDYLAHRFSLSGYEDVYEF